MYANECTSVVHTVEYLSKPSRYIFRFNFKIMKFCSMWYFIT